MTTINHHWPIARHTVYVRPKSPKWNMERSLNVARVKFVWLPNVKT